MSEPVRKPGDFIGGTMSEAGFLVSLIVVTGVIAIMAAVADGIERLVERKRGIG